MEFRKSTKEYTRRLSEMQTEKLISAKIKYREYFVEKYKDHMEGWELVQKETGLTNFITIKKLRKRWGYLVRKYKDIYDSKNLYNKTKWLHYDSMHNWSKTASHLELEGKSYSNLYIGQDEDDDDEEISLNGSSYSERVKTYSNGNPPIVNVDTNYYPGSAHGDDEYILPNGNQQQMTAASDLYEQDGNSSSQAQFCIASIHSQGKQVFNDSAEPEVIDLDDEDENKNDEPDDPVVTRPNRKRKLDSTEELLDYLKRRDRKFMKRLTALTTIMGQVIQQIYPDVNVPTFDSDSDSD